MKIYCSTCDKVQPVRIDNCRDAKTHEPFQDIVCATCDLVIASGTDIAQPEFVTHTVEQPDDWSEWVCPDPKSYLMKCCDCGLVHEAQFGVVRYKSETEREDCDIVDDPNLQAVFRMRRSEQWTPKDTAYRPGGLAQPEQDYLAGVPPMLPQMRDGETIVVSEQEPVAWMFQHEETGRTMCVDAQQVEWGFEKGNPRLKKIAPLYTTPPQRKPLTDEEIYKIANDLFYGNGPCDTLAMCRAIEAAHGIKE